MWLLLSGPRYADLRPSWRNVGTVLGIFGNEHEISKSIQIYCKQSGFGNMRLPNGPHPRREVWSFVVSFIGVGVVPSVIELNLSWFGPVWWQLVLLNRHHATNPGSCWFVDVKEIMLIVQGMKPLLKIYVMLVLLCNSLLSLKLTKNYTSPWCTVKIKTFKQRVLP